MRKTLANQLNKYTINCDWLQIHIKIPKNLFKIEQPFYNFKKIGQSKVFKEIWEIKNSFTNTNIAVLCCGANEQIMKEDEAILKIDNSQLYINKNIKVFVETIFDRLNLKFLNITRMDICLDFLRFYNFYRPEKFIKDYLAEKFIKVEYKSKTKCGIRWKEMHSKILDPDKMKIFELNGSLNYEYDNGVIFCQDRTVREYQTIVFGNSFSTISSKMYNKTKELLKSSKKYISEIHNQIFGIENKEDVWRLEFSIYNMNALFFNSNTEVRLKSLEILNVHVYYGIFQGLFDRYFDFRVNDINISKIEMMRKKVLWYFDQPELKLNFKRLPPLFKNPTKKYKTVIKTIDEFNQEFRRFDDNLPIEAKTLISKIISMHSLEQWAIEKNIDFDNKEKYLENLNEFSELEQAEIEINIEKNKEFFKQEKERIEKEEIERKNKIQQSEKEFLEKQKREFEDFKRKYN